MTRTRIVMYLAVREEPCQAVEVTAEDLVPNQFHTLYGTRLFEGTKVSRGAYFKQGDLFHTRAEAAVELCKRLCAHLRIMADEQVEIIDLITTLVNLSRQGEPEWTSKSD